MGTRVMTLVAARLRRLVIELDPESAQRRYEEGVSGRRVVAQPNPDGTANPRRPTTHQKRTVQFRQPHCVFPGCRIPATQTDLDHTQAVKDGGPTTTTNLGPLCRHDHRLKHQGNWQLTQPTPGVHTWTSRHGHTYTTQPPPS